MCTAASLTTGSPLPAGAVAANCAAKPCFKTGCPGFPPPAESDDSVNLPIAVSPAFIGEILRPYRQRSRYLKEAVITHFRDKASEGPAATSGLITAEGKFAIEESCYIDDTGHFNAVEFNICYNQLAYVMFGKCVAEGLMGRLRCERVEVPTFSEFKRHQLPNMVIVSIESRYYRQLDSRSFTGTLRLERISPVGGAWFFFTTMTFADSEGVKAKDSVVLAFSPSFTPVAH
ncbi:MAG: FcoT family thioesterase [Hyphomicrobiaceae bacterium]